MHCNSWHLCQIDRWQHVSKLQLYCRMSKSPESNVRANSNADDVNTSNVAQHCQCKCQWKAGAVPIQHKHDADTVSRLCQCTCQSDVSIDAISKTGTISCRGISSWVYVRFLHILPPRCASPQCDRQGPPASHLALWPPETPGKHTLGRLSLWDENTLRRLSLWDENTR